MMLVSPSEKSQSYELTFSVCFTEVLSKHTYPVRATYIVVVKEGVYALSNEHTGGSSETYSDLDKGLSEQEAAARPRIRKK